MGTAGILFGLVALLYCLFCFIGSAYVIKKYDGFRIFYDNLNKMFKYQGRVTGIEYASFVLLMTSISVLFEIVLSILGNVPFIISFIVSLLFALSMISVTTRRLHDLGYSGWLQIPMIIIELYSDFSNLTEENTIGLIFLFLILIGFQLFLMFKKGQQADNQYGKVIK